MDDAANDERLTELVAMLEDHVLPGVDELPDDCRVIISVSIGNSACSMVYGYGPVSDIQEAEVRHDMLRCAIGFYAATGKELRVVTPVGEG